jgi:predicted LPLAT superfamily acyltransferase
LVLEHFSDGIELSRKKRQDDLEQLTQQYASSLERQVAQSPLQWFNFYDFWAGSTEGDSAV